MVTVVVMVVVMTVVVVVVNVVMREWRCGGTLTFILTLTLTFTNGVVVVHKGVNKVVTSVSVAAACSRSGGYPNGRLN